MSDLPNISSVTEDGQLGGGYQSADDYCVVFGCSSIGTALTPRLYTRGGQIVADFGYGPGPELAAHIIEVSKKPVIFVKLASITAGAASAVDASLAPTGTSVLTLTGAPYDTYDGLVEVTTGGTRGTTGIVFRYSLDGGRNYVSGIALGTAVTYTIPNSGITLNFAAGTLVAGEIFSFTTTEPDWQRADFGLAFAELAKTSLKGRLLAVAGILGEGNDVDTLGGELDDYADDVLRPMRGVCGVESWYPDCVTGPIDNVVWDNVGKTATRGAGSFVTDGWKIGMQAVVSGSDLNNGTFTVANVGALVLTFSEAVAADADDDSVTFTGSEPEATWIARMRAEYDSSYEPRVGVTAGHCLLASDITPWEFRRPLSYAVAAHAMKLDLQRSLARVKSGALDGVKIHDENGDLVEHDERVLEGCIDGRFICARTFNSRGKNVYVALPKLMHAPGSDFTRLHLGFVFDKAQDICNQVLEGELNDDVALKPAGTITELAARQLEDAVNVRLKAEVLAKERASSCKWTCSRTDDLSGPGATLNGELTIQSRGYLEKIATTYRFARTA